MTKKLWLWPAWALPCLADFPWIKNRERAMNIARARREALTPERITEIARMAGHARAQSISKERLHEIAMLGVAARMVKTTPEQRSAHAAIAGRAGCIARWGDRRKRKQAQQATA